MYIKLAAMAGKGLIVSQAKKQIVSNYDSNIKKSLQKNFHPNVKENLPYKDADIIFAVNGYNGMPEELDRFNDVADSFKEAVNAHPKYKINVIPFTVKHDPGNSINPIVKFDSLYGSEKATDKVAELVSTVKAYQKRYPDKKITLLGFSMGGSTVTNAADLLQDPKIQTISLAGPNIRGVQPPNYTAIRLKKDGVLPDEVFTGKEHVINDVQGHNNLFGSKEVMLIIAKKLFGY